MRVAAAPEVDPTVINVTMLSKEAKDILRILEYAVVYSPPEFDSAAISAAFLVRDLARSLYGEGA